MANFSGITKEDGTYVFYDVEAGKYCYKVSKDRYIPVEGEVTVDGKSQVDVTLAKERFKVTITVLDETDKVVSDAEVKGSGFTIKNNGDGTYEFETIHGEYEYTITKERYVTVKKTVEIDRENVSVTVKLERYMFDLTFSVKGEDGKPIEDAEVTLFDDCNKPV